MIVITSSNERGQGVVGELAMHHIDQYDAFICIICDVYF